MNDRTSGLAVIAFVYVVASLAGLLIALWLPTSATWVRLLCAALIGTLVVFAGSRAMNNSSVYDPYWSVYPIVTSAFLLVHGGVAAEPVARRWLVMLFVLLWGVRLTWNWARGFQGPQHEDWRYVNMRHQTGSRYWLASFAGLHLFPTVLTYLGSIPLIVALGAGRDAFNLIDGAAICITALGIAIEAIADYQLHLFRQRNPNPGKILDSGLWSWCRHPNYLGEILFWWGLFLFGLAADAGSALAVVGPLGITLLITLISVRLIDKRMCERRPGYEQHMRKLPAFIPKFWK